MANDGQIVFEVTADGKHAIADIKAITKAIQQEAGKWDDAAKGATDGIESKFSGMLKKLAAGFSAAKIGKALLDLGKDALAAASDLQEVQNVVDVTFGSNANQIETWAKNAGTQFGLTETQAKKFSSTMGAMLKSSGLAGSQIVEVSTDLAGLAADMASFYNLDFEEAFSKIRSGMSGMTMPLKELGIDMSVDTLNAYALAQGMEKTYSQMSQSEQTMLRYQYLMKSTADAQGDFARTSDGYANALRTLETNLTTLKTNLGNVLLDIVNPLINGINELFSDRTGDKTVLDDFAGIDTETERKIEQIRKTAEDANELVAQLDKLGSTNAGKAGDTVKQFADSLSQINLNQDKAGIVKDFISSLSKDIPTLAAITGSDADGAKEWLKSIAEGANTLEADDADGWANLINSIKEGLPGLDDTDFGASFFSALGDGFSTLGSGSSVLDWAIKNLGNNTERTAEQQALWLQICKNLVKTIPGLSSIINTETGEIKGGTQAVYDYIKAWEEGQTRLALIGALEQKESAIASRFSTLPELQLDMLVAEKRVRDNRKKMDALYDKYKFGKDNRNYTETWDLSISQAYQIDNEDVSAFNELALAEQDLEEKATKATAAYNKQKEALDEAKEALEESKKAIEDMGGSVEDVASASEKWWQDNADNIKVVANAAAEAVKAMEDYANGIHEASKKAVYNVAHGLDVVNYSTYKANSANIEKIRGQLNGLKEGTEEWKNSHAGLEKELEKYNSQLITTDSIMQNLQSQADFLGDYLKNIREARRLGLDENLLAELSDGSVESAQYLDAIVNSNTGTTIDDINKKYREITAQKDELAKELANSQLQVDDAYKTLAENAKEAVNALAQAIPASEKTGSTMQAIADAIKDHVPDVAAQVDSMLSELNRLNGYGISIDFGGFGKINFNVSSGKTADDSGRFGVDFVPRDDYLIRAHEGERLLTAQENQVWNTLLRGGRSGFDLDDLGGVMRDNVKPGGNVYLDGRIVGSVISDQQGRSYRQLQRSGWQS